MPAGYSLVWNDEFNGTGLPDAGKWVYDTEANLTGWYNNEEQYYAVRKTEYSRQQDGRLFITARKASLSSEPDWGGQVYTSARLITRGKASWTYGFFEIRARMPCGQGTWPAIWMLGTADNWPDSGEIDIMEHVGMYPDTVSATIHTRSTAGTSGNGAELKVADACTAFHNYQATWTADRIVFAVDGKPYHSYGNKGTGAASWPFNKPQYLLLNLAIGGEMAGWVDPAVLPRSFEVDYVRVYQKR